MKIARIVLLVAGGLSVLLGLWHFGARSGITDLRLRASSDLVALSMLFAGLVTASAALMALSRMLLAAYSGLFAAYYAGFAIVLLYNGIWLQGLASVLLVALGLGATWRFWTTQPPEGVPPDPPTTGRHPGDRL